MDALAVLCFGVALACFVLAALAGGNVRTRLGQLTWVALGLASTTLYLFVAALDNL